MLEIPQLCACGTDRPLKVIQAALINWGPISVAFHPIWLYSNTFVLGLDWWKIDICQLIHMHIFEQTFYISHALDFQISTFT